MSIDLGGLQSLIEVVNNHPQGMISVQRAIELLTELRVSWKLSCRLERWQERIHLMTSEHDIGPVEFRIEMPHGHEQVALGDTNQVGPRTFERRGSFDWPMDRFGLTVSYDGRQETIDVFGPYLATLARGYLTDETIPSVGVSRLAVAIAQLITGKAIDLSSITAIGAGFRAKAESKMGLEVLTEFLGTHQSPGS